MEKEMIQKWKDYYTDTCDNCGDNLTKLGVVYVVNKSMGLCVMCYEHAEIYIIHEDMLARKED